MLQIHGHSFMGSKQPLTSLIICKSRWANDQTNFYTQCKSKACKGDAKIRKPYYTVGWQAGMAEVGRQLGVNTAEKSTRVPFTWLAGIASKVSHELTFGP